MSKGSKSKSKSAKRKVSKRKSSDLSEKSEDFYVEHPLLKYAEENYQHDSDNFHRRKYEITGIHIADVDLEEDEIIDPKMLLPKEEKKIKINKGPKKKLVSNDIDVNDLMISIQSDIIKNKSKKKNH